MFKSWLILAAMAVSSALLAQSPLTKPENTEVWDPEPRIVQPAKMGAPPSDAIVLFDGSNANAWAGKDGKAVQWKIENGAMTVEPGTGDIHTIATFGDFQLHLEWRSPMEPDSIKGQGKGNSGVFLQDRYEVQILNSYQNRTYANGQAACVYKQTPPLVNACVPMGEWNVYDIIYRAPRFRANGSLAEAGTVTVLHNGIVVQHNTVIQGTTEYIGPPHVEAHGAGPIRLQDHSNKVSYRNIWLRPL